MASVELRDIVKVYAPGQEPTVKGIDLTIEDGEFFILLGPSGCGKSTLLRMIAGLESITSGTLRIGDRVVNDVHPKDRDIAMVFQSYALYPHLTVRQNLGFGLKMRGTPRDEIERRIAEIAPSLGLEALLDRLPKALSGGQRQRVALGRAIVREPAVFLLDEPLSNLDAKLRGAMRVELKRLHNRLGTTMIYVTHDQVEAMTLGDRVAVLSGGTLQQVGPPMEVYDRPANQFVAGFLGSPPMNFLRARVAAGTLELPGLAWEGEPLPLPEHLAAAPDGDAVVGVRPEDVALAEEGPGLRARVAVCEPLGAETIVTADVLPAGADPAVAVVVARIAGGAVPAEESEAVLRPDPARLHLFAAPGGERLGEPPASSADRGTDRAGSAAAAVEREGDAS